MHSAQLGVIICFFVFPRGRFAAGDIGALVCSLAGMLNAWASGLKVSWTVSSEELRVPGDVGDCISDFQGLGLSARAAE